MHQRDTLPEILAIAERIDRVAQTSLRYGADDFGSTMFEENVVKAAGVSHRMNEEELKQLIVEAG